MQSTGIEFKSPTPPAPPPDGGEEDAGDAGEGGDAGDTGNLEKPGDQDSGAGDEAEGDTEDTDEIEKD